MTKILVLTGGVSSEREVSLSSGEGVLAALKEEGFDASAYDFKNDVADFAAAICRDKPDVVFNALHGQWGEDGCVQGLLDMLGAKYTHSGRVASAIGMDKVLANSVFAAHGIPIAKSRIVEREEIMAGDVIERPYVLKPVSEGSSVGVQVISGGAKPEWPYRAGERVMAEEYIPGRELTVPVFAGRAMGVIEIVPKGGLYDYASKYTAGGSEHLIPAPIGPEATAEAMRFAEKCHDALGCRGLTRVDMRYDEGGRGIAVLEINTQPGMTPTSLCPDAARAIGISYNELCRMIVGDALK
ncbi:MAG: D-alanine--D-alanine ligase [Rickettsiales bacterium]|jgi:D-alanine-D-alanine ligase|nr:D-alanine--D-alanine ligase [Rickettsiales bacterium]